jgi:hypothetical protein
MMPFLVAGEDSSAGLLIATLGGDMEEVTPLGRSFLRRAASRAVRTVNPVAQIRNVAHGTANIARATGRVGMQLSRGNVRGAFVDLGRAATQTIAAPITTAVSSVDPSAGKKLEGIIRRNDPNALINRKIFDAVKRAVRPIVRQFSGDVFGFGEETPITTKKAALRAARGKILAASTAAGTAAGTSVAGPYGAPVGAALVPAAVDAVIEEISKAGSKGATAPAPAADEPAPAPDTAPASAGLPVGKIALGVAVVGGALYFLKKKGK